MPNPPVYCEAIYQGYKGVKCQYVRSDGLSPEGGFIDLHVEDFKPLKINVPGIAWRAVNGLEMDGMTDIRTWARSVRATITGDRPPAPEPKGKGVNQYGDLLLRTLEYPSGKLLKEIRYSHVYVNIGMGETTRGLANILDHKEGIIRIPFTDIRRYYANYGALFCRINCRRKNGEPDKETYQENGDPWPLSFVLEFLFAELPGSPAIHGSSELYQHEFKPPEGIEGQGEPVVQVIEKVLDQAGLKAQMQPNGNYAVTRRFSSRLTGHKIITDLAVGPEDVEGELHYETITETPTDRPSAVCVVGGRRVMRMTFPCVAALKDRDGLWYEQSNLMDRWASSMDELNKSVFVSPEFQNQNVNTQGFSGDKGDKIRQLRREILRGAYKYYLPAFLFIEGVGDLPTIGARSGATGGLDLDDPDFSIATFLPMLDAAWYESELKGEGASEIPRAKGNKGDLGPWSLVPPVVRGHAVEVGLYADMNACLKTYEALKASLKENEKFWQTQQAADLERAGTFGETLLQSEKVAKETVDDDLVEIGKDVEIALRDVGLAMREGDRIKSTTESETAKAMLIAFSAGAKRWQAYIDDEKALLVKLEEKFKEFQKVYHERRVIPARGNGPQTIRRCSVDKRTGLITSGVPLCRVGTPFFFDGDAVEVAADGAVNITFGFEIKGSNIAAFTNFLFVADDGGDQDTVAQVKFAGCHRSSPIKAKVLKMESREYLQENGNPVNLDHCYQEAKGKASAALEMPRRVSGRVLEITGLRDAVLDAGTTKIEHEWDGAIGWTRVYVNATPGTRRHDWGDSDYRENQQRDR